MRFTESRGKSRRLVMHSDQLLGRAKMEALEARQLLAGVTVITHGYQLTSSDRPSWLDDMALTIEQRLGEYVPVYSLRIERGSSGLVSTISRLDSLGSTKSLTNSAISSGEAIVLLDWADASGVVLSYYSTSLIASYAVDALVSGFPTIGITNPLAELPIHLMGHSRGGSVVSEMSRLLGQKGIVVDQQTTWDPCPASPDPSAAVYANTLFADNYYQEDTVGVFPYSYSPQGALAGAYNIDLQGLTGMSHTVVHDWYHATIPPSPSAADTSTWYSYSSTGPRNQVGFAWSRIGGTLRPADGIAGTAYRSPLTITASGSQRWDNVLMAGLFTDVTEHRGDSVTVPLAVLDANHDATVWVGVDTDSNPYDGVTWLSSNVTTGLSSTTWQASIDTSTLAPGTYHVSAKITNGTHTTYDYSRGTLTVLAPPPTDISLANASVPENQPAGTIVGRLRTTAAVAGSFTYSLVSGTGSDDNALFAVSGDQLVTTGSFDYETRHSYQIRVRTTNGDVAYIEKSVAVVVADVNETPTDIALTADSLAENLSVGTAVGTLSTVDADFNNGFAYSLVSGDGGGDNSLFAISGNQLKTAASFNYEARSSYSVRVRSRDQGGLFVERVFTIHVTDVNEGPTALTLSSSSVAENQLAGTMVGTLAGVDPDQTESLTYSFAGGAAVPDNALFTLDGTTLRTYAPLDYELKKAYSIRVRVTDKGGLSFKKDMTVNITDVNERPTNVAISSTKVAENMPIGTVVGSFGTTDADVANTFIYTLVGDGTDNAAFTISANGRLRTAQSFDFETKSSYSIRIRSTDQGALFCEKAITINVTNVNEAPTGIALTNSTVLQQKPAGTLVGKLVGTDPDAASTLTYTLVGGIGSRDNAMFTIVNGKLRTSSVLDDANKSVYKIRVRVTDQGGLWFEKAMVIGVTPA